MVANDIMEVNSTRDLDQTKNAQQQNGILETLRNNFIRILTPTRPPCILDNDLLLPLSIIYPNVNTHLDFWSAKSREPLQKYLLQMFASP